MAGKDFRLTALLAVRDRLSPVLTAVSKRWSGFQKVVDSTDFRNLQKQMRLFTRSMQNVVGAVMDTASKIAGLFAALAGTMGFSLQQAVTGFAETGDALDKMSQRLGMSSERLQEWSFAATHAGAAPEDLEDALKDLSEHMAEIAAGVDTSSDAFTLFQTLGIQMKDSAGNLRPVEAVFNDLADAIQRNEDPALRTKMALATMGDSGRKLIPMMSSGAQAIADMAAQARHLGLVMSNEDVAAAAQVTDHMADMKAVLGSVGTTIGAILAPTVIRLSDQFRDLVAANRAAFSERFAAVAQQFADSFSRIDFQGITNALLTIADYGIRAFNALGGFNTVLYTMGALMAGKTVMSVISLGSSLITMGKTLWGLATAARTVGIAMAGALGPVGLVLSGVALAAGVVIANWDKIWPAIKDGASAVFGWLSDTFDYVSTRFAVVAESQLSILKALFTGDIPGLFSGFDDLIVSMFNLLPQSWAKACIGWYESIKASLKEVGRMIGDFFANFKFSDLIPDGIRNLFSGLLPSSGGSQQPPAAQSVPVPALIPDARMSGQMAIQVTAVGGASVQIAGVESSDGLTIRGSVGRSERSIDW